MGAELSINTRYLEYQDGSLMTDGIFMDKDNTTFDAVYGSGNIAPCFMLENGNVKRCNNEANVLCEKSLDDNTFVCLNEEHISSVTLESSTELEIPTKVLLHTYSPKFKTLHMF